MGGTAEDWADDIHSLKREPIEERPLSRDCAKD
jgi:hypothetical protein